MLKIKEFAQFCGCSVHTLRFYDSNGILKPAYKDTNSGYRYYTKEQKDEFIRIKQFQDINFSLEEIKSLRQKNEREILKEIEAKINHMTKYADQAVKLAKLYQNQK